MKTALIDLGSNTIKLAAYETDGKTFSQFHYELDYTYVIGYVENSSLTQKGIDAICNTLLKFQKKADELDCSQLCCFSTASLRYIQNQTEVIQEVFSRTGIQITPISGEQEAYYNFLSMKTIAKAPDFFGADLGGGSLQLFCCQENQLRLSKSFPLGALKMYTDFVKGIIPTSKEADDIVSHCLNLLKQSDFSNDFTLSDLFLMGGSARLIQSLLGCPVFSAEHLAQLTEEYLHNPEAAQKKIEKITPERVKTVVPAMLVIGSVCQAFEIKSIHYTENSVREGYFIDNFTHSNL